MEGQKSLIFHSKCLPFCFEDERKSYVFGTAISLRYINPFHRTDFFIASISFPNSNQLLISRLVSWIWLFFADCWPKMIFSSSPYFLYIMCDICRILRDLPNCDFQTWVRKWTLAKGWGDGLFPRQACVSWPSVFPGKWHILRVQ